MSLTKKELVAAIVDSRNDADREYKAITGHYIDFKGSRPNKLRDDATKYSADDYFLYGLYATYESMQEIIDEL